MCNTVLFWKGDKDAPSVARQLPFSGICAENKGYTAEN